METLNKNAVTKGLIIAVISIVLTLLQYYVAPQLTGSAMLGIGMMLIMLLVYIFFTLDLRKQVGGFWTFKQALQGIFLMAFVAGLVSSVVQALYFTYIEPEAFSKVEAYITESFTKTMEAFGTPEDKIEEALAKQIEGIRSQYSPTIGQFFQSFGIYVIIEFVMSLIFAAIFKKNPPVFLEVTEE